MSSWQINQDGKEVLINQTLPPAPERADGVAASPAVKVGKVSKQHPSEITGQRTEEQN